MCIPKACSDLINRDNCEMSDRCIWDSEYESRAGKPGGKCINLVCSEIENDNLDDVIIINFVYLIMANV